MLGKDMVHQNLSCFNVSNVKFYSVNVTVKVADSDLGERKVKQIRFKLEGFAQQRLLS